MFQTIKQQFSLEVAALLLALSWVLLRLLSLVVRKLESGKRVSLLINGHEVASLQVEARKSVAGTVKAEKLHYAGYTGLKTGNPTLFSQAVKPALLAKRAQKRVGATKEGSIK